MSLIKQLWMAIIILMTLAFSASFIVNTITSRHYLAQQLETKNTDNAVSLALSISQMPKDPIAIDLMLAAQFDNGHYQYIRLVDPNGKLLSEKTNPDSSIKVPQWFMTLLNIHVPAGVAQIQDGWKQYGTLSIVTDPRFAYQELWQGTLMMLFWTIAIGIGCGIVGSIILKVILNPLKQMAAMTQAIANKNFVTINEPKTLELKSLARAMNQLSARIKEMFVDQAQLLEELRLEANHDPVSGLMNRRYFSSRVAAYISNEETFSSGLLVITRISNLAQVNLTLGNTQTDALINRIGVAMNALCEQNTALVAGRLTGADFAIFSSRPTNQETLCSQIKAATLQAANLAEGQLALELHASSTEVNKTDQLEGLKKLISVIRSKTSPQEVDIMKLINFNDMAKYEDSTEIQWRKMLTTAIAERRIQLAAFPVKTKLNQLVHQESPVRLQLEMNGAWRTAAEFIPWAIELDLITSIDDLVVDLAINALKTGSAPIGLNVSTRGMCNPAYIHRLSSLLKAQAPAITHNLWLEVPESGVFSELENFKLFCSTLKPLGCKIGIKHVGSQIARLGELHDLHLDYIKIDASIIRGIDHNTGNKAFLKGICLIAHSINLMTIAEGVQTELEMAALPELGIDAMTGPAVK
ncbi:MAG TPA: EAL domain-containing protein [Methylophilaceae bacterium]|jgi:EAL domain-containing protein (putative c-di-GMP-specific phosphodiesterase class I)/GGDEF domain-containing protein